MRRCSFTHLHFNTSPELFGPGFHHQGGWRHASSLGLWLVGCMALFRLSACCQPAQPGPGSHPQEAGTITDALCSGLNGCRLPVAGQFDLGQAPTTKEAGAIADALYSEFVGEEVDKVELVYTKFVSLISSDPIIQTLLPLTPQVGDLLQVLQLKREQLMNSCSSLGCSRSLHQGSSRSAPIIKLLLELTTKLGHAFWHDLHCPFASSAGDRQ